MAHDRIPAAALSTATRTARRVRALEAEALAALRERGDVAGHRAALTEKCRLLAALPDEAAAMLPDPAAPDVRAFVAGLEDMASRADMAQSLESVFFMGALLYPEDYREGDPNDLERFLGRFESAD